MEEGFKEIIKKTKENVTSYGKKAVLAGGLLLGTLTASELKAQQISGAPKTEQQDSTLYKEAEQQYQKLVAHRDSILEYNAEIKKMNLKMEKVSNEVQRSLYEQNGGDFRPELDKKVIISAPKYITQKGVASDGSYFSRDHQLTFQEFSAKGISKVKEETVAWKTFINSHEFTWPALDEANPAVKYTRDFFRQYTDTKTGKTFDQIPIRMQGAESKMLYCPISLDPHKWSHPSRTKHTGELYDYTGDTLSYFELIGYYGDYGDDERFTFTIKKELERSNERGNHSLQEIEHRLTYKGEKPKSLKLACFETVQVSAYEPHQDELSKGNMITTTDFSVDAEFICTPVWGEKRVPKLPKKEKFISSYIASHQSKSDTVHTETKAPTTEKDVVDTSHSEKMHTEKQKDTISALSSGAVTKVTEQNTFPEEQPRWDPVYGPNGGLIGSLSEWGTFVPLPANDIEHLTAHDPARDTTTGGWDSDSSHATPDIYDIHWQDRAILKKYYLGKTDPYIENQAEPRRKQHAIDLKKKEILDIQESSKSGQ